MVDISILILTKNEAKNIGSCLEAVFLQKSSRAFEVIVIDSGSTDGTMEIAGRFPVGIFQINPGTFHHARTRNYAARLAQAELLVYLAADAFPAADNWLDCMVSSFDDSTVGAVYGRHLPKPGSTLERQLTLGTIYGGLKIVKGPSNRRELGYKYYHYSTVNSAIRKTVWDATQFPEQLKVFEDVGIAKRILDGGWKIVYEPAASVYHSHNHAPFGLFRRYFDMGVVYRRLDLLNAEAKWSMYRDGIRFLRRNFSAKGVGRSDGGGMQGVLCDLAKYSGFFFGRNERLLPRAVRRRWSSFGLFD